MKTTFEFNLDNKVTVWNRTTFTIEANSEQEAQEKIKELIKNKTIDELNCYDINFIEGINMINSDDFNYLTDTTENMTALENNGHVIEISNEEKTFYINENLENIG